MSFEAVRPQASNTWELVNQVVELYVILPEAKRPTGWFFNRKRVIESWVRKKAENLLCNGGYKSIIGTILIGIAINLIVRYATKKIIEWIDLRKQQPTCKFEREPLPQEFVREFYQSCVQEKLYA